MHIYLEIIISLIGLYIVFSIINSAIVEGIAQLANARGKFLYKQLKRFFSPVKDASKKIVQNKEAGKDIETSENPDIEEAEYPSEKNPTDFITSLYQHTLIKGFKKNGKAPSYINKKIFAQTFLELILQEPDTTDSNSDSFSSLSFKSDKQSQLPTELQASLKFILDKIPEDIDNKFDYLKKEIEDLYEAYMERVTTWYKQRMRFILGVAGIAFAAIFNLDTINFYHVLKTNDAVRAKQTQFAILINERKQDIELDTTKLMPFLTAAGRDSLRDIDIVKAVLNLKESEAELLSNASLGIGIHSSERTFWSPLGYLLTGLALSFGSTFWFGLLRKIIGK